MNSEEKEDLFLDEIVKVIKENFIAVESLRDVEELITTQELIEAVTEFYPLKEFNPADLVQLLNFEGFRFTTTHSGPVQFVWLLKRR
jgi:hypothetical protein